MKSRLTIDARWLVGGIGTYTRELLQGLSRQASEFGVHAITREQHREAVEPWCARVTVVNTPIYTVREQWAIPWAASGTELLHVPHYNVPLLMRTPLVVTIHDVIHLSDPDSRASFKTWAYARPVLTAAARKAAHIITDSEYSKGQIVEHLRVPRSKVSAIHCGVTSGFSPMDKEAAFKAVSGALRIDEPYLLFVGNLKRHKNVSTLLTAFALLRDRREMSQRLVLIGNDTDGKRELIERCAHLGISERVDFVPHVTQELLPKIYAAADALIQPSRIEGFGLPVLEAMACGTPVICSRAASLPEVAGEAASYFDPNNSEELADAIEPVLDSPKLQTRMRTLGLRRAARFTWHEAVAKHIGIYRAILN